MADGEVRRTIVNGVERALDYYRPEQIFLNPDCGFGTFSRRRISDESTAVAKMKRLVEAAVVLRERYRDAPTPRVAAGGELSA